MRLGAVFIIFTLSLSLGCVAGSPEVPVISEQVMRSCMAIHDEYGRFFEQGTTLPCYGSITDGIWKKSLKLFVSLSNMASSGDILLPEDRSNVERYVNEFERQTIGLSNILPVEYILKLWPEIKTCLRATSKTEAGTQTE